MSGSAGGGEKEWILTGSDFIRGLSTIVKIHVENRLSAS